MNNVSAKCRDIFDYWKERVKNCESSVKARRVLSQAPPVDSNQQAKKKRNNAVTREERNDEKGIMKKREREKKTRVTPARGLLSILNEPRVALRDSTVGSCWLAIVITRCREHMRRGVDDGVKPWREQDQRQWVNEETRRCECGARAPFTHRNWRWLMPTVVELWFNSISLKLILSRRE